MPRYVDPDPPGLAPVITREQALAAGLTSGQIQHRLVYGQWRSFHRGIYVRECNPPADPFSRERYEHVLRGVSVALARSGLVLGQATASLALELPLISPVPCNVHLLVDRSSWSGTRGGIRVQRADLTTDDVTELSRFRAPVTTDVRTWVDIAHTAELPDALAVGDALLRRGLATAQELIAAATRVGGAHGERVSSIATQCSGRRETPLESFSWARFLQWGIPLPLMQESIYDSHGFVGRVDFLWPEARLIGEADGRLKYSEPRALWQEKRRQIRLEREGYTVVRWVHADLSDPRSDLREHLMHRLRAVA